MTYICKDGSRFPAIMSLTELRDDYGEFIGYLLIGTNNAVRKRVELDLNYAVVKKELRRLLSDVQLNLSA